MSKLKTNAVGPWTKKECTISGAKLGDSRSKLNGVFKFSDGKFQFREDGIWKTLSDPIDFETNAPLRLVHSPGASFSGPRKGNVFKRFEDLYLISSAYPGMKEILFDNGNLNILPPNIVSSDYSTWPNASNCCVIPAGHYNFKNTILRSMYPGGNAEKMIPMFDLSHYITTSNQVPILIKNGAKIKNLSSVIDLLIVGDEEGYDEPPILYSTISNVKHVLESPAEIGGGFITITYFALLLRNCWLIGGGGSPAASTLIAGRTRSLIMIDGYGMSDGITYDPITSDTTGGSLCTMVVNTTNCMFLGNNVFSLKNRVGLSLQDLLGTSSCFQGNFTTELDTTAPASNSLVAFTALFGKFNPDHSDWGGSPIQYPKTALGLIEFEPDSGIFSPGSEPESLEEALNRMGGAIAGLLGGTIP